MIDCTNLLSAYVVTVAVCVGISLLEYNIAN